MTKISRLQRRFTIVRCCANSQQPAATQSLRRGAALDVIVAVICGLVIAILIPIAVYQSRLQEQQQRRNQALHRMGVALQTYHQTWNAFPSGGSRRTTANEWAQPP